MKENNTPAIMAYITIIGSIVAILMNTEEKKTEFNSFHIRQGLGINLSFHLFSYFIGYFDSWIISVAYYVLTLGLLVIGFIGAANREKKVVPIVGLTFQNLFKNL